jgi:hypothetical protein
MLTSAFNHLLCFNLMRGAKKVSKLINHPVEIQLLFFAPLFFFLFVFIIILQAPFEAPRSRYNNNNICRCLAGQAKGAAKDVMTGIQSGSALETSTDVMKRKKA